MFSPIPRGRRALLPWLAFAFLISATPTYAATPPYQLDYGDTVTVTVVGQPTMSIEAQPVRPDGRISLPLLREFPVQGKTVTEVSEALIKAYRPYLAQPQVVVHVERFRPVRVSLMGQVARPGTFNFEKKPTLVDALATAGGLTERANRGVIKVIGPRGQNQLYDLDRVLAGQQVLAPLEEGSIVEVSEVWGPDFYRLVPLVASILTAGAILVQVALLIPPQ